MFLCSILINFLFLLKLYDCEGENSNKISTKSFHINPNAYYRIDSVFNKYSISEEKEKVKMNLEKKGDSQNFIFKKINDIIYYIELRHHNLRLGVDDENNVVFYKKEDEKNAKKIEWVIEPYKDYDIKKNNYFTIKNNYNSNYLELSGDKNFTLKCSTREQTAILYYKQVFEFIKIFEILNIKPEHLEKIEKEPIDIVIKYIDLSDEDLDREGIYQIKKDEDNEELKYSLRSIIQYVPWVRKIFIIMPNEKVRFLKPISEISDKFVYVKDKDLIGFDTSNSAVFQFNMFRLAKYGLSDNFIYMDDDYFFGKELNKSDFFYYDEEKGKVLPFIIAHDFKEIGYDDTINYYNNLFKKRKEINSHTFWGWKLSILASEKLILENFHDGPIITTYFTHVAVPLNIHEVEECYDLILRRYQYIEETLFSVERHILILQSEHLFNLYGLNVKKRKVHSIPYNYVLLGANNINYLYIPLFVFNTDGNQKYTDEEYKNGKKLLEKRFPQMTKYELTEEEIIKEEKEKNQQKKQKEKNLNQKMTYNNYIMDDINEQKKMDVQKKYKFWINEYKKSNSVLLLIFVILWIIFIFLLCIRSIRNNAKYENIE